MILLSYKARDLLNGSCCLSNQASATKSGAVLVLHTPNIEYIFEIYLGIICIAVGKNRKENMEGLKTDQLSTVVVTLLYSTLLDDLSVKGSILLDLVFYS